MSNAICEICEKEMSPGTPCTYTRVQIGGSWYDRDTQGFGMTICGDCNSPLGSPHHWGCDNERCPKCGRQFIGCDCFADDEQIKVSI